MFPPTPEPREFGDTKHRLVRYEPVATTSFGDCFPPEFGEQPERGLLSLRGEPVEHVVLSSAKPAAPEVLDCLPTVTAEAAQRSEDARITAIVLSTDLERLASALHPARAELAGTPVPAVMSTGNRHCAYEPA